MHSDSLIQNEADFEGTRTVHRRASFAGVSHTATLGPHTIGQLGRAGNGMDGRGNCAGKSKCLLDSRSKYNSCFANPMWPAIHMVPDLGSISFPVEN